MTAQLTKANLENLPSSLRTPLKVWQLLEDHSLMMREEGRSKQFLYVELTNTKAQTVYTKVGMTNLDDAKEFHEIDYVWQTS